MKATLEEMSTALRNSLDKQPYLGTVTVIVPPSWECTKLLDPNPPSWPRIQKSDIRVTADHPVFGSIPYTFQYGMCGHPGLAINAPLTFLTNTDVTTKG